MSSMEMTPIPAKDEKAPLELADTICIIIGIVVGVTIFRSPALIFMSTPESSPGQPPSAVNPWGIITVWILGGLLAIVGALCYSELATTYPRPGGDYNYLTNAFGRWVGFLFGWAQIIILIPAAIGTMVVTFADFAMQLYSADDIINNGGFFADALRQVKDWGLGVEFTYAALVVLLLTLLNLIGVTFGKWAQILLTLAKLTAVIAVIVAGFWSPKTPISQWPEFDVDKIKWGSLAIIMVLYAYGGWNDTAFVAAEVRKRRRNIPAALIISISIIALLYVLVAMAYMLGLGLADIRNPGLKLPSLLIDHFMQDPTMPAQNGNMYGGQVMSAIIMISALGAANGLIFTGARVYSIMGNDYTMFRWLGHWRPGRGAPVLALIFQAVMTIAVIYLLGTVSGHALIMSAFDSLNSLTSNINEHWKIEVAQDFTLEDAFERLVRHTAPLFWFFFLLAGISLFVLREKNPQRERPFSVPLYPVLPIIFCNCCAYMLYQATIYAGWLTLVGLAPVLLGIPLYFLARLFGYRGDAGRE